MIFVCLLEPIVFCEQKIRTNQNITTHAGWRGEELTCKDNVLTLKGSMEDCTQINCACEDNFLTIKRKLGGTGFLGFFLLLTFVIQMIGDLLVIVIQHTNTHGQGDFWRKLEWLWWVLHTVHPTLKLKT